MRRLGIPPSELSLLAAGQRHLITGILKKVLSGIPAYPSAQTKVQGLSFVLVRVLVCSTSEVDCPNPLWNLQNAGPVSPYKLTTPGIEYFLPATSTFLLMPGAVGHTRRLNFLA